MKGQYRIIMEIMLFAVGLAITTFILVSFQDLQKNTDTISVKNQMDTVLNNVLNAVVKASITPNSAVKVNIPVTISGRPYKIFVEKGTNLTAIDLKDPATNVTRQIFNIDKTNSIEGEAVSTAGIVEITNNGAKIIIQRG